MNIEKTIRDVLLEMSAVTDIVGTRIWDEWFRSATLPAVVVEIDNEAQVNDLTGISGKIVANVNVICRATTRLASRTLSEAVRINNTHPGTGLAGYDEKFSSWLESRTPAATPTGDASNSYWYDTYMAFVVAWNEDQ